MSKARVAIVDDHPVVREGLKKVIDQQPDLAVCWDGETAASAVQAIPAARPDILIVDLALAGMDGLELVKNLRALHPQLPVLVLSMHDENLFAERALRAGARGYIMKHEAPENLLLAIRRVLAGDIYLSRKMQTKTLDQITGARAGGGGSPLDLLSDRELEVFRLLGQGQATRQIAGQLNLSIKTVETYRAHIMEKLNLSSATELVQRAFQWVHEPKSGS